MIDLSQSREDGCLQGGVYVYASQEYPLIWLMDSNLDRGHKLVLQ